MKPNPINFLHTESQNIPAWTTMGALSIALALALFFNVFNAYQTLSNKQTNLSEQIVRLNKQVGSAEASSRAKSIEIKPVYSAQEIKQISEIRQSYSVPWNEILSGLEDATTEKVALLSVTPNVDKRSLELIGEARNITDATAFIESLQQQEIFRKAYLQEHAYDEENKDAPMLFVIQAEWGAN